MPINKKNAIEVAKYSFNGILCSKGNKQINTPKHGNYCVKQLIDGDSVKIK